MTCAQPFLDHIEQNQGGMREERVDPVSILVLSRFSCFSSLSILEMLEKMREKCGRIAAETAVENAGEMREKKSEKMRGKLRKKCRRKCGKSL